MTTAQQPEVERLVSEVMKRANALAPNSNFVIDGFAGVKLRNLAQAIIEVMLANPEKRIPVGAGDGNTFVVPGVPYSTHREGVAK